MTDEPDDSIDELLSADLDGQTTPDEHRRIEADPELLVRRNGLRLAARTVGSSPPPLDPVLVDSIIDRTLARFDRVGVDPIEGVEAPTRRSATPRRSNPWLVAAVVMLVAGIGIGLIATAGPSKRKGVTATGDVRSRPESKSANARDAAGSAATTTAASSRRDSLSERTPTVGFIGTYASPTALRSALRSKLPPVRQSEAPEVFRLSPGQADRCSTVLEARDPRLRRSNRRAAVTAGIAGEPLLVLEYRAQTVGGTRTSTRIIAVGVAACDERLNFER